MHRNAAATVCDIDNLPAASGDAGRSSIPESVMRDYQYVAWFRNRLALPDDQDREWPACFVVTAENELEALAWGDHLARDYSSRNADEEFLRSYLDSHAWPDAEPRVMAGEFVPDEVIGW